MQCERACPGAAGRKEGIVLTGTLAVCTTRRTARRKIWRVFATNEHGNVVLPVPTERP